MNRFAVGGVLIMLLAGVVFVVGKQHAGYMCSEKTVNSVVPRELRAAEPEGYGWRKDKVGCVITHQGKPYKTLSWDPWDADELALAMALVSVGVLGYGFVIGNRRKRPPPRE